MPNLAKIYSDHTGRGNGITPDGIIEESDAARKQVTHQWLQSTPTQEMFSSINSKICELLDNAVGLATDNKQDNSKQIISNLKEVNILRNIIKEYGQSN